MLLLCPLCLCQIDDSAEAARLFTEANSRRSGLLGNWPLDADEPFVQAQLWEQKYRWWNHTVTMRVLCRHTHALLALAHVLHNPFFHFCLLLGQRIYGQQWQQPHRDELWRYNYLLGPTLIRKVCCGDLCISQLHALNLATTPITTNRTPRLKWTASCGATRSWFAAMASPWRHSLTQRCSRRATG